MQVISEKWTKYNLSHNIPRALAALAACAAIFALIMFARSSSFAPLSTRAATQAICLDVATYSAISAGGMTLIAIVKNIFDHYKDSRYRHAGDLLRDVGISVLSPIGGAAFGLFALIR